MSSASMYELSRNGMKLSVIVGTGTISATLV